MSVTQLLGPCLLTGSFLSHDTIECGPQSCFWELTPLWKQRLLRGPPKSQLCSLKQDRLQAAFPVCGSWHAVCMCECSTLPGHGLSACAPFRQSDPVRLTGSQSRNRLETRGHNCATLPKDETQHASDRWDQGLERRSNVF